MVLVEHEVRPDFRPEEYGGPLMAERRILVEVDVLVAIDITLNIAHYLPRRDGRALILAPLVPVHILSVIMDEAHQLPHLVVVRLHLYLGLLELCGLIGQGSGGSRSGVA